MILLVVDTQKGITDNRLYEFDNEYFSKEVAYDYYNRFMWPERYAKCITMEDALEILRNR
ncbi:hypothetical protein HGO97_011270 [Faecalicatena sp. AGMB00832]|uniref:Isochorismatase family protein n=1 Tax=Faecalicatena faecalis TaxID=2726362 RepID=A0ABS6D4I4_9FIRM|nr:MULTISPECIES: hypothetical protein [Faecalicatena]MBU3876391.1 hypothetical protein [Faecalicatena faecalis]MCI6464314.1 hypothetical protein [Faecalicatena sp.]MDY5621288.1 hypothetical protein [Lachnospiraceae bacterium]